jgi:phage tail-like protein
VDWKDLYSKAFPQKKPFKPYNWPELPGSKTGAPGSYPTLPKKESKGESSYPSYSTQAGPPGNSLPKNRDFDHIGDFGFRVEIGGMYVGGFTKVEGLNAQVEVVEYQHGDDITPRKRMGRIKVDNIRLIKGYINDPYLYKWCESAMRGDIQRQSMSIILLDDSRMEEVARYNIYEVWPTKWSGFKLDAMGRGALVEEIELVVERLERA